MRGLLQISCTLPRWNPSCPTTGADQVYNHQTKISPSFSFSVTCLSVCIHAYVPPSYLILQLLILLMRQPYQIVVQFHLEKNKIKKFWVLPYKLYIVTKYNRIVRRPLSFSYIFQSRFARYFFYSVVLVHPCVIDQYSTAVLARHSVYFTKSFFYFSSSLFLFLSFFLFSFFVCEFVFFCGCTARLFCRDLGLAPNLVFLSSYFALQQGSRRSSS